MSHLLCFKCLEITFCRRAGISVKRKESQRVIFVYTRVKRIKKSIIISSSTTKIVRNYENS